MPNMVESVPELCDLSCRISPDRTALACRTIASLPGRTRRITLNEFDIRLAYASAVYADSYDSDPLPDRLRRNSDECDTFCGCGWDAIPSELHPVLATKLSPDAPGRTGSPLGPTEAPDQAESLISAAALCFAKPAVWPGIPLRGVPGHTSCAPLAQVGASRFPEGGTDRLRLSVGGGAPEFSGRCLEAILATSSNLGSLYITDTKRVDAA